jgi:cytochrome b
MKPVKIWDLPTRLGHWLLAGSIAVAWATGESERWQLVHVAAGSLAAAVVLFRLIWGLIGSRHARFISFLFTPGAVVGYLKSLLGGRPDHYTGHNPAGSYAIYLMLLLALLAPLSGWLAYNEIGGHNAEELHEALANGLLLVVGVHVAGVVLGSLLHRENLPRAMITGFKLGAPEEAIKRNHVLAATLLLIWGATAVVLSRYL